jgi:hypothetical protein
MDVQDELLQLEKRRQVYLSTVQDPAARVLNVKRLLATWT